MVDVYCCLPHVSKNRFWFFLIEMDKNAFARPVINYCYLKLYQSALSKIPQLATHL